MEIQVSIDCVIKLQDKLPAMWALSKTLIVNFVEFLTPIFIPIRKRFRLRVGLEDVHDLANGPIAGLIDFNFAHKPVIT